MARTPGATRPPLQPHKVLAIVVLVYEGIRLPWLLTGTFGTLFTGGAAMTPLLRLAADLLGLSVIAGAVALLVDRPWGRWLLLAGSAINAALSLAPYLSLAGAGANSKALPWILLIAGTSTLPPIAIFVAALLVKVAPGRIPPGPAPREAPGAAGPPPGEAPDTAPPAAPVAPWSAAPSPPRPGPWRRHPLGPYVVSVVAGAAYGIFLRASMGTPSFKEQFPIMSIGYIFLVPFATGYLVCHGTPAPTWLFRVFGPWLSCLAGAAFAALVGWEGAICIVMALPAMLIMASIGGLCEAAVRALKARRGQRTFACAGVVLLPLLTSGVESRLGAPEAVRTVATAIDVAAGPGRVWPEIAQVRRINKDELRPSLFHRIGFPRPVEATLHGSGTGAVRHARFEKGVLFIERVTAWEPDRRLAFTIKADTPHIPSTTLDEHVTIGGRYFDMLTGEYAIEPLGAGRVRIHLASRYRLATSFNFYSGVWCDAVLRSIQESILEILKTRAERPALEAAAPGQEPVRAGPGTSPPSQPDDPEPAGAGRQPERSVVRREHEIGPLRLGPEHRRGEVDGVETSQGGRERLRGARQDRTGRLDQIDGVQEPVGPLAQAGQVHVGSGAADPQAIERPQALHLDEGARDAPGDLLPLLQPAALSQKDPQQDGRVDVGGHRSVRRSSISNATGSTSRRTGAGNGTLDGAVKRPEAFRTLRGSRSAE